MFRQYKRRVGSEDFIFCLYILCFINYQQLVNVRTRILNHYILSTKTHISKQKQKRHCFYAHKKHLRRKKSLIRIFSFLCFLCVQNLFVKKKKVQNCPNDLIYITTHPVLLLPTNHLLSGVTDGGNFNFIVFLVLEIQCVVCIFEVILKGNMREVSKV